MCVLSTCFALIYIISLAAADGNFDLVDLESPDEVKTKASATQNSAEQLEDNVNGTRESSSKTTSEEKAKPTGSTVTENTAEFTLRVIRNKPNDFVIEAVPIFGNNAEIKTLSAINTPQRSSQKVGDQTVLSTMPGADQDQGLNQPIETTTTYAPISLTTATEVDTTTLRISTMNQPLPVKQTTTADYVVEKSKRTDSPSMGKSNTDVGSNIKPGILQITTENPGQTSQKSAGEKKSDKEFSDSKKDGGTTSREQSKDSQNPEKSQPDDENLQRRNGLQQKIPDEKEQGDRRRSEDEEKERPHALNTRFHPRQNIKWRYLNQPPQFRDVDRD